MLYTDMCLWYNFRCRGGSVMQSVRIVEFPDCRMVSSGTGMFGDGVLERFDEWLSMLPRSIWPRDFLMWDEEKRGFRWLYLHEEGLDVPADFSVIDFPGGLYAVTTGIDQQTDVDEMRRQMECFLAQNGLKRDETRPDLGNVITSLRAREILGYEQMDYYTPVKAKEGPK